MSVRSRSTSLDLLHANEAYGRLDAIRERYFQRLTICHQSLLNLFHGLPETDWRDIWKSAYAGCMDQVETIVKTRTVLVKPTGEALLKLTILWLQIPYGTGWKSLRSEHFHDVPIDFETLSI